MMTLTERLFRHPQGVWARRALFQIHLWTGIGVGLYILAISLSGSAIVFRREIARLSWSAPTVVQAGPIMTAEQLGVAVKKAYPRFEVTAVTFHGTDHAAEVLMTRGQRRQERAFDPYSGKDLGPIGTDEPKLMIWLVAFHDDLLAGKTGRLYNGVGAILFTALCLTGLVIWWPGVTRWWRSLLISRKAGWRRFNWDVHSAVGFWMLTLMLLWGISGIYLAFPDPFTNAVDYLQPFDANGSVKVRSGDEFLAWLAQIHFGRAYGKTVKWLYTILGLAPAILFVTGGIMWWNRSLRPLLQKRAHRAGAAVPQVASTSASDVSLEA